MDDSRVSNTSPATSAASADTKGDSGVYVEHADFSKSLKHLEKYPEEEKFEWREIVRG